LKFTIDFDPSKSQKVSLTPQLKQTLDILSMNSQELYEYIEKQLEANPVLDIQEDMCTYGEIEPASLKTQDGDRAEDSFDTESENIAERLSLKEYLLFQLQASKSKLNKKQVLIAEYLIDNIDENGYLTVSLTEVAAFFNMPLKKVNTVLEHLQTFEPSGICARSLKECLLIQLKQIDSIDRDIIKLVDCCLDDLASGKFREVAESTGLNIEKVIEAYNFIKTLEPKPGREFYSSGGLKYIVPDVIVKKLNGRFEALINEEAIPVVIINEHYKQMMDKDVGSETRSFIQNKIDNAMWLIQCIEQRKSMLRKVAEIIVEKQHEFLEKGKDNVKPLTTDEVSEKLNVHKSIVERVIEGKHIQCLWGIFEMRHFFKV